MCVWIAFLGYGGLKRLSTRHHKVIDLLVKGLTRTEVSRKTTTPMPTISSWLASPIFQDAMSKATVKRNGIVRDAEVSNIVRAREKLDQASLKAANKLDELIDSDDDKVALAASEAVLNRALPKKVEGGPAGLVINADTVAFFQQVMRESDAIAVIPQIAGPA